MTQAQTAAGPDPAFLSLSDVCKIYPNGYKAVENLHIDLPEGQMLGLLGPSGCGKTTTLRMIAGLMPITSGTIRVGGRELSQEPPHRRDMGLVFQNYALFPHMTVAENVAFGLEMRGVSRREARGRIEEALEMVRLPGLGSRRPRELSGGQQQRVSLARALVIRPRILLLDEPLSNLDAKLRDEMRVEIREIQQRLKITTLFVTHDQVEALTMCDLVGVMHRGKLAQLGTPEDIYERPESLFVSEFVGRTNKFRAEVLSRDQVRIGHETFRANTRGLTSGTGTATVRPHRIALTPDRDRAFVPNQTNAVRGRLLRTTYIGDLIQYDLDIGGQELKVEHHTLSAGPRHQPGEMLLCEWAPADMIVYGEVP
ncbi:ABC transporter ATP-binding protein [Paenirhodobacter sp.]|uniref:ABC transporter ATP-binding protein n=1 Tax=Paenirhodobacter sp. TaxID=1965326 RepID=UPI003B3E1553